MAILNFSLKSFFGFKYNIPETNICPPVCFLSTLSLSLSPFRFTSLNNSMIN